MKERREFLGAGGRGELSSNLTNCDSMQLRINSGSMGGQSGGIEPPHPISAPSNVRYSARPPAAQRIKIEVGRMS